MDPERHSSLRTRLGDGLEKSLEVSKYTVEILFRFFKGLIDLKGLTGLLLGLMAVVPKTGNPDLERLKFEFLEFLLLEKLPMVNLVLAPTLTVTSSFLGLTWDILRARNCLF